MAQPPASPGLSAAKQTGASPNTAPSASSGALANLPPLPLAFPFPGLPFPPGFPPFLGAQPGANFLPVPPPSWLPPQPQMAQGPESPRGGGGGRSRKSYQDDDDSPIPETKPSRSRKSKSGDKRKQCNCKNSRCLKLYCECFAAGIYCDNCNCKGCCNNKHHEKLRKDTIDAILDRNPHAFKPKITAAQAAKAAKQQALTGNPNVRAVHHRGCHCKKSHCLKKYCECYQAGVFCSENCRCQECRNHGGENANAATLPAGAVPLTPGSSVPTPLATPYGTKRQKISHRLKDEEGEEGDVGDEEEPLRNMALASQYITQISTNPPPNPPSLLARPSTYLAGSFDQAHIQSLTRQLVIQSAQVAAEGANEKRKLISQNSHQPSDASGEKPYATEADSLLCDEQMPAASSSSSIPPGDNAAAHQGESAAVKQERVILQGVAQFLRTAISSAQRRDTPSIGQR